MAIRMIVDTDTASDDAVALAMALRHPEVEVAAVTTVAGNCPVDQATRNALYTVELCGADVPVYQGAAGPLVVDARFATWFHGEGRPRWPGISPSRPIAGVDRCHNCARPRHPGQPRMHPGDPRSI